MLCFSSDLRSGFCVAFDLYFMMSGCLYLDNMSNISVTKAEEKTLKKSLRVQILFHGTSLTLHLLACKNLQLGKNDLKSPKGISKDTAIRSAPLIVFALGI
ncbi:hypothetical protein XENOCAPTIV_023583 [Xenoophorus captivus]|uniref:Uncharacterized protein n=1 Tax=Xenoophorus captivus TaxID=1517983 RepID=A0ABV0S3F5_9TELE